MTAPASARRSAELLWSHLRLVALDTETVWESGNSLPEDADAETRAAIEQVRATGEPVRLRPRSRRVRYFQHQLAEAEGLTSGSDGEEPARSVEIRPGTGTPQAEPVATHEGRHRVVSVALVEAERGKVTKKWHSLVNPGCPVDADTLAVHRLTDERLAAAPPFPRIAGDVLARLTPKPGETLVLVAHNAPFDAGVLRTEFSLLGHSLPDLPVLDTQGPLARAVGIEPADASLKGLLAVLGIANPAAHSADGDATATAAAALELLRKASERGVSSADEMLALAGSRRTGAMTGAPGRIRPSRSPAPFVSPEHLARHAPLPAKPSKRDLAAFERLADECGQHRCPDLGLAYDGLVRATPAPPALVLDALAGALRRRAAAGDGPGANTVLGAIAAVFERWCPMPAPPTFSGPYPIARRDAVAAYHGATAVVAPLPPCAGGALCAHCRAGRPCPRRELARSLAAAVLAPRWKAGRITRESTMLAWIRTDEAGGWFYHHLEPSSRTDNRAGPPAGPELADAALVVLLRFYATHGEEPDRGPRIRDQAARFVALGVGDPALAEIWAGVESTAGRPEDLRAAIAVCDEALKRRPPDGGDSAWASLQIARDQFAGRLGRIAERRRIRLDGTVEVVKPHRPGEHKRREPVLRFSRA